MSAPSATDASDGEEDYTEDSGLSFKLQITVRSCAGAEMHVTGAGRTPESRSPRLPPIFDVPPNSATSGSGDSKDGGKHRSRYHSGCIGTSPGRSDTKSSTKQNKRNIQKKDRTPSHETAIDNSQNTIDHDSVAKYLLNHPEFLEAYVMENSSPEIIEKWLLRKLKLNAAQGMRQQRKSSLSRYRMYIDSNKSLLLQNLLDTIRMYPTLDQVLWEIGYRAGLSVGTDGFNVFRLKKSDPDLLDVLVGAPTEKPVRSVSIAKVSMPVINEIVTKGQPMRLSKDSTNNKYPRDLICSNKDAQHVMYLPITMPEEDSAAVLELWRMNSKFYEEDEEIATSYLMWGAITLHYVHLYTDMLKQRKLQDYLLDVAQSIFQDMGSLEDLVEKIMLFAQELVQADRASLFLVDSKTKELYATVFDVGVEGVVSPTGSGPVRARTPRDEIRFPIGTGIAGYVAQTGEVLNIKDAYKDGRFNSTVDLKTGYRTKTILCMPIFIRNTIIGVVQMVNKLEDTFSASDEESFKMFATYCGLALHHSKLYNKIKRSEQKYKVALEVLSYHNTCSEEEVQTMQDDIKTSTIKQDDFTFNPFDISEYERAIGSVHMFTDLFGLTDFDKKSLTRFVLTVKKNYRKLPYHNWAHGFAVANTMYNILKRHDRIFSRNESLALFIGSLCHDLDHRGKSNKFMLESESPLAAMYSTSTMEHHHFNQTVIILQQEGHNIFAQLSNSDYKQLLGYLKHCILATDLAAFFPNRDKLSSLLRNEQYDWDIKEHRSLALAICMTAADLSASAKPWKIQTETVKVIFQEFYDQGDLERAAGREPIAMMDRNRQEEQAASQVGFISGICLPCYELLYQIIPKTKPLYHMCLSNLQRWKRTDEQIREYMHAHKDYGYEIVIFLEKLIAQVEPDDFEKDEVFNKSNNSPHTFKQNDSSGHSKIPISKSTVNKMNNLGYKHKLKGGKIEKFDNQAVGSKRFDHVNVSDTTEIKNASFLTVARCEILSPVPLPVGQSLIQKIDDKIKNADSVADSNTSNNSNVDGIMKRDRENSTCSLPSVKEEDCDEAKFDDDDDNDCAFNDRN